MVDVQVHDPFLLTMFQVSCDNWKEKKQQLLNLIDWNNPACVQQGVSKQGDDEFFTDYFVNLQKPEQKPEYHSQFKKILKEELTQFVLTLEQSPINRYKAKLHARVRGLWAQRYVREQLMQPHTHDPYGYSAVLYTEFDGTVHQSTEFFAPFKNIVDTMDYRFQLPKPKEGDILFFPSFLLHYSIKNPSDKPRTIFSFNLDILPV